MLAVLAVLVIALFLAGRTPGRASPDEEARGFYERLLELAAADKHDEVLRAIEGAKGRHDRTTYGVPIRELGEASGKEVAKRKHGEAVAHGQAAEAEGRLDDAVRSYEAAEAARPSSEVTARLVALRKKSGELNAAREEAGRHGDAARSNKSNAPSALNDLTNRRFDDLTNSLIDK